MKIGKNRGSSGKAVGMDGRFPGREMGMVIWNQPLEWSIVTRVVPKVLVLAPVMLAVFINDMAENITKLLVFLLMVQNFCIL